MAGHSHWAGIKHKKGRADKERSKIFSKLSRDKLLEPGNFEPLAITPFILITFIIGLSLLKSLEINFIN